MPTYTVTVQFGNKKKINFDIMLFAIVSKPLSEVFMEFFEV